MWINFSLINDCSLWKNKKEKHKRKAPRGAKGKEKQMLLFLMITVVKREEKLWGTNCKYNEKVCFFLMGRRRQNYGMKFMRILWKKLKSGGSWWKQFSCKNVYINAIKGFFQNEREFLYSSRFLVILFSCMEKIYVFLFYIV